MSVISLYLAGGMIGLPYVETLPGAQLLVPPCSCNIASDCVKIEIS